MNRIAPLGLLCLLGSAASAWTLPAAFASHALLTAGDATTVHAAHTQELATEDRGGSPGIDIPYCVSNFSKDGCDGVVEPGTYSTTGCDATDCKTIVVRGAVYKTSMRNSGGICGDGSCTDRCDQFPDGTLTLKFNYVLRNDSCCFYRGSWDGEWRYVTDSGAVYYGDAHGTIGVGTNRRSECDIADDGCEPCHDVQLVGDTWIIGWEGSFRGESVFSTIYGPDELNFTTDSSWAVSNQIRDPFNRKFRAPGRFDGVHITKTCP